MTSAHPEPAPAGEHTPIVLGIGGSAGALVALITLLEGLGDVPLAVVVVLHLSPDHESHAVEMLQRVTPLRVTQVKQRMRLAAGNVYVVAPGMNLITDDGHVQPAPTTPQRPSTVIDLFFRSLGDVHHERAIGIVLSGTGHDGALGLTHVKECGGLTIVQTPGDCEYPQMSQAALESGHVDLTLSAAEMGKRLPELSLALGKLSSEVRWPDDDARADEGFCHEKAGDDSAEHAFHDILAALRGRTRHDFRHYKRATLMRRLERRMQIEGLPTLQAYRDLLRRKPEQLLPLLADFLISVTSFFRDAPAFEALQRDVLAPLLARISPNAEARIWVPACASGEEAYSVAMLMQEHADRMAHPPRVQIFASDINEAALQTARAGLYPANVAADITESRLMNFFDTEDGGRHRVRPAVREMILFAHHNVIGDPPFSRLDLICCRNLLIYLDRTAQGAVLDMFAYALKPGGHLFLGNAESIDASAADMFDTVDKEHRIYRLRAHSAGRRRARIPERFVDAGSAAAASPAGTGPRATPARPEAALVLMHERALVAASPASVLINAEAEIERISVGAGRFIAFGEGIPTRKLLGNVAPDVRVELRAALFRAGESGQPVEAIFRRSDEREPADHSLLALSVHPVAAEAGQAPHYLVTFAEPAEDPGRLGEAPAGDNAAYLAAMHRLEEENRSLKSHLQQTLDRSAASNEALKVSNEELQAINKQLSPAKEELETSKEELQSVNEELTTVNFELRMKVDEAGRNNDDLRNLIEASGIATVFVDAGMRVKRFTPQASKLFALIPSDIGRPLMDVKSRLHYDEIVDDASAVFKQLRPVERSVSSVDGEHFFARILPYRTSADKIGGAVLTFINVTELRRAEERVRLTEERLRDAIASNKDFAVISTDGEGIVTTWNEGATLIFGFEPAQIIGQPIDLLYTSADRAAGIPKAERATAARDGRASDERYHLRADGSTFYVSGVVAPLRSGQRGGFIKIARDLSVAKARENLGLVELAGERRGRAVAEADASDKNQFLAVVSHELKQPLNMMQLTAELLVRLPETKGLPAVQRIGASLKKAVAAQATIVNDLLDLSRIQTGKMQLLTEPTDLAMLVTRLGEAFAEDASGKGIALAISAPGVVMCECDPVRMEQIVWNLLGNAVKFTGKGQRIDIRVTAEGNTARLVVADTGVGISAANLPHIFDLYDQGGSAAPGQRRSGLGIGLALARELADAHGGSVRAESPGEGLGTTLTVEIPLSLSQPRKTAKPVSAPLDRRILVVDDSVDGLSMFVDLLRMEGAQVDSTSSPAQALEMIASTDYDLVLSDIGMPEMSGLELMRQARALRPSGFKSAAITGYGSESDKRDALAAGFDAHLSKPVSIERLRALLETLGL